MATPNQVYKCLILDDDAVSRKVLEHYVSLTSNLQLAAALDNGAAGLNYLLSHNGISILLLDIEMPELSGLELLKSLPSIPETILITSHSDYAIDAFDLQVTDYLVKPVTYARFSKAIIKATGKFNQPAPAPEAENPLFIKVNNRMIRLELNSLLYVEALSDYVVIATDTQKHVVYSTMKAIEEKLSDQQFLRVHRSYIINLTKVKAIEDNSVLIGDKYIPVSKSHQSAFYSKIKLL